MPNLHSIYAIYQENCPNKDGNFEQLLAAASEEVGSTIEIRIVSGSIEPGAETIEVSGPWWRDGESTSNDP